MLFDGFQSSSDTIDDAKPVIAFKIKCNWPDDQLLLRLFASQMGLRVFEEGKELCCILNDSKFMNLPTPTAGTIA